MNIYSYIGSNKELSKGILNEFGYAPRGNDMGENLRQLVASEGEKALKVIVANHPDKDLILDIYQTEQQPCQKCADKARFDEYLNATGSAKAEPSFMRDNNQNFSVVFLAGIMILTVALIKK